MSDQESSEFPSTAPEGFQPPPPPPSPPTEQPPDGPQMSVGETLIGIFFEPGKTFESLRARPRFLVAALILTVIITGYTALFFQRVGFERVIRESVEVYPGADQMSPADKEEQVRVQSLPIFKVINYGSPVIGMAIILAAGGALYLLGSALMGGRMRYKQALSVWTYSFFPPLILTQLLNVILLFIKSPDDYDIISAQRRGLVQANLSLLVSDPKASPVLATLLSSFDVFSFYGLFLAAIGMRIVGRMSSGSAWAVVITIWLVGVVMRIGFSILAGSAM